MGTFFSKNKTKIKNENECRQYKNKVKPKPTIKEMIQHYEFIKRIKQIDDVDTILEIINNTDWNKTMIDEIVVPNSPEYENFPVMT